MFRGMKEKAGASGSGKGHSPSFKGEAAKETKQKGNPHSDSESNESESASKGTQKRQLKSDDDDVRNSSEEDENNLELAAATQRSLMDDEYDEGKGSDTDNEVNSSEFEDNDDRGLTSSNRAHPSTAGDGEDHQPKKAKMTKSSLETLPVDLHKVKKRKWIEPTEAGDGYLVIVAKKHHAPIVNNLEDARVVVELFQKTGYIGVRKRDDKKGFDAFFIMNGTLHWLDDIYSSTDDAAKAHDEHLRANHLSYIKNFRVARGNQIDTGEAKRFNRNADLAYTPSDHKLEFIRTNITFTKNLCVRLSQDPTTPSVEIWRALEVLMQLCTWWGIGRHVPMRPIRNFSGALQTALRIGDRQLCKDAIGAVSPHEQMDEGTRAEREEMARKKLVRERLRWTEGIFEQFQHMYMNLTHRRYPKAGLGVMAWGSEILRLHGSLLTMMDDESKLNTFGEELERMENHPLWKHHSDFLCLRGEFLLSRREDLGKMRQAQRLFAKSLKADSHNARAMMFLTASEHVIHEVQSKMMSDNQLMSISQRTTQDTIDDDEEMEDEDAEGNKDFAESTVVIVTKRINEAIRENPRSAVSWLALEGLLFVEASDFDSAEVKDKKRVCLLRLVEIMPTVSSSVLVRLDQLWALTRERDVDAKIDLVSVLMIVVETLTQKECPTYSTYYSQQSIPVWEHLVCCLTHLPIGTVVLNDRRLKLWRRRFFPNTLGYHQDPFNFYKDAMDLANKSKMFFGTGQLRPHQYVLALKAIVAEKIGIAPAYHSELVTVFGQDYIDNCVQKAIETCNRRADNAQV